MSVLSTTTKGKLGIKAGKTLAKNPKLVSIGAQAAAPAGKLGVKAAKPIGKMSFKTAKPLFKRRARHQAERMGEAARTIGEALAIYGPQAAYELGLAEPPKAKRTAPRVVAGILIGACAVYFLEPGAGREHRKQVAQLVG